MKGVATQFMQIITFAAIKGGVGKTTLTYNLGEWLTQKEHKKVLLIDADSQSSLSQTYKFYYTKYSLADIFSQQESLTPSAFTTAPAKKTVTAEQVIKHTKTVDILPSALNLDQVLTQLPTRFDREFILYMWFEDNYDYLKQYDYILIDCHPDFSIITQNAIIISDLVFSPIEPSQYSLNAKNILSDRFNVLKENLVDPKTIRGQRESYVKAQLYFIGNRINDKYKISQEFIAEIKKDPRTVALIPEQEIIKESTLFANPVVAMTNLDADQQKFQTELLKTFANLIKLCHNNKKRAK